MLCNIHKHQKTNSIPRKLKKLLANNNSFIILSDSPIQYSYYLPNDQRIICGLDSPDIK